MKISTIVILVLLLTTLVAARKISDILKDGQGDFDPWNETRWSAWYSNGTIIDIFEIDTSITFANRADDWIPKLSSSDNNLFHIVTSDPVVIDGNNIVIDARQEAYRDRSLDEVISGDEDEWDNTQGGHRGFYFEDLAFNPGVADNVIKNITIRGFQQGIKIGNGNERPLRIEYCTFNRNEFGAYTNHWGMTVYQCLFFENGGAGIYSGNHGSNTHIDGCTFRDNNITRKNYSYGDINFDTGHHSIIENCTHLPTQATVDYFRQAISFYRNAGGGEDLRENIARNNIIRNNSIDSYDVGYSLGSRMGREANVDISEEGRDYANNNLFISNSFNNTEIGFKVNTPANTIQSNEFINVSHPIVLHCVFYGLTETVINDQSGDDVRFWFTSGDYADYQEWFHYQDDLNNGITEAEKIIHVRSDYGAPNFPSPGEATFINAPTLMIGNDFKDAYSSGGTPIDIAVGDFDEGNPGDEFAVIWDQPISNIRNRNYYSIIFYDKNGVEINRSGRSTTKWRKITAGNFNSNPGEEVVVVTDVAIGGRYPLYFYRRGYKNPFAVRVTDNESPIISLTAGDFYSPGDGYDEVAYIVDNSSDQNIHFASAISNWIETSGTPKILRNFHQIAAGNFDSNSGNGDEIAAYEQNISASLKSCWDFEDGNGGTLSDKAYSDKYDDNLSIIGSVNFMEGKATITENTASGLTAEDSDDLDLSDEFTIWVRAKVLDKPVNPVSLVDKRNLSGPESRSYAMFIDSTSSTDLIIGYESFEGYEDEIGFVTNLDAASISSNALEFKDYIFASDKTSDYFAIIPDMVISDRNPQFNNVEGQNYLRVEDTDADGMPVDCIITLNPVNLSGYSDVKMKFLLAQRYEPNYERGDFVKVQYRTAGSGIYSTLTEFRANKLKYFSEDTNLDRSGDGAELSEQFTEFTYDVNEVDFYQVRFIFDVDGGEELGLDGIKFVVEGYSGSGAGTYGIGGEISKDGGSANSLFSTVANAHPIPVGEYRELVMRCTRDNGLRLEWFASTTDNPISESQWRLVNRPVSDPNINSIFNSTADLKIGNTTDIIQNSAGIEFDEIRIYSKSLSLIELAAIEASEFSKEDRSVSCPIYYYFAGQDGYYDSTQAAGSESWTAIAGGDFDGNPINEEVVVAGGVVGSVCEIKYYYPSQSEPFKISGANSISVTAAALCGGKFTIDTTLVDYEMVEGFSSFNYGLEIDSWGDQVMILPSRPQTTSIPLFTIINDPANPEKKYLRLTPLVR